MEGVKITIEDAPVGESTHSTHIRAGATRGGFWPKTFDAVPMGKSFALPRGTKEEQKVVRNCTNAARAYNKVNNARKIVRSVHAGFTRFGPVPGPGAVVEEVVTPGE